MHYYLALTSKCNLLCKYCYGKSCEDCLSVSEEAMYDFQLPDELSFSIEQLKEFASKDDDFILTFYGGEPLCKVEKIREIMDEDFAKEYMIQTNGTLLHTLEASYVNRLSTILVSIDGTKEHTDERRGVGVYDKVMENLNLVVFNGFEGEIIARMTVDETCDIFESVRHLYLNSEFSFSSIHWQLDAQFWKSDYSTREFAKWVKDKYNPGIGRLVDWWFDEIVLTGKIPMIYPFVGVMESLLFGGKSPMKCGAGHSLLGIQTNGKVVACPITAGYMPFEMGDVRFSSLEYVESRKILPAGFCEGCSIKDICGGRCLYANKTRLWGKKGFFEVCDTIFFLVEKLREKVPVLEEMFAKKKLNKVDFEYRKYNGCEIIP